MRPACQQVTGIPTNGPLPEQLSVSKTTLYQLVKTGQIEAVKVAADLRIPADALTSYVARQAAAGKGA